MNIFIYGGIREAVKRLIPVWESLGHRVTSNILKGDVQLAIIKIKAKTNFPTVLRLDGIYYDKGDDYMKRNASISKAHSKANAVIYQSFTSQRMCEKYLSKRQTNIYSVIHNGIDSSSWNNFKKHSGVNIVCCAKWRRPKRLPEIITVFDKFLKEVPDAKLHIIGQFLKGAKEIKHDNVIYHGKVNYEKMKRIYSIADMHIHLCKKDSCPSTVLESIASGVPVITTNACGGATEMCLLTDGCIIVSGEKESLEPDYIYRDEYNKIPSKVIDGIVSAMLKIVNSKSRVIIPTKLGVEYVGKKYLEIMERVI